MTNTIAGIWHDVSKILKKSLGQIFTTHLAYTALGMILFTPLVGAISKLLLHLSGQTALSDLDILYFFLTPSGIASTTLLAALMITIIVFEQASLMAISAGRMQEMHIDTMSALFFTSRYARKIYLFSLRLVLRILVIVLPFLVAATAIAWFLITDYDINYYLAEKPPIFLAAAAIIGLILSTMVMVLARKLLSWSLALPFLLFNGVSPSNCFKESEQLTLSHKKTILVTLGTWALAAFLLEIIILGIIQLLSSQLVPLFFDSIKLLVVVLGGMIAVWTIGNLLFTTLTSGSFACIVMSLYQRYGADLETSDLKESGQRQQWRFTAPKLALFMIGATVTAVLVGFWLLDGVQPEDNVMVIAHRGAAGKAPENTLTSMRQAIKDGTDWIEIDVQETADGQVVVIHDSDFMKLAGVNTKIWDGTLKQLQKIDVGSWFAPEFSEERIPTLEQVLEEARGKARVLIELKHYGHDQQLEQRVVDIVEKTDMVNDVAIMSLKYEGIQKFHALRPDWDVGLLLTKAIGNITNLEVDFLAVNMAMVASGFIRRTHSAGKQVFVWTVNDQISMSRMMSLGIDGLITDEPELARKVLVEREDLSSVERLLIHTAILAGQPIPKRVYRDKSP